MVDALSDRNADTHAADAPQTQLDEGSAVEKCQGKLVHSDPHWLWLTRE
jgi:hypothetical protein